MKCSSIFLCFSAMFHFSSCSTSTQVSHSFDHFCAAVLYSLDCCKPVLLLCHKSGEKSWHLAVCCGSWGRGIDHTMTWFKLLHFVPSICKTQYCQKDWEITQTKHEWMYFCNFCLHVAYARGASLWSKTMHQPRLCWTPYPNLSVTFYWGINNKAVKQWLDLLVLPCCHA